MGCTGVFSGLSSSDGAFCWHLMYFCKEPHLISVGLTLSGSGAQEAGKRVRRSPVRSLRVPGKERRRQSGGDLQERWVAGAAEPSLALAASRIPSARSLLRPGCDRHAFLEGVWGVVLVKKPHRSVMDSECEG